MLVATVAAIVLLLLVIVIIISITTIIVTVPLLMFWTTIVGCLQYSSTVPDSYVRTFEIEIRSPSYEAEICCAFPTPLCLRDAKCLGVYIV